MNTLYLHIIMIYNIKLRIYSTRDANLERVYSTTNPVNFQQLVIINFGVRISLFIKISENKYISLHSIPWSDIGIFDTASQYFRAFGPCKMAYLFLILILKWTNSNDDKDQLIPYASYPIKWLATYQEKFISSCISPSVFFQ